MLSFPEDLGQDSWLTPNLWTPMKLGTAPTIQELRAQLPMDWGYLGKIILLSKSGAALCI